MRLLRAADNLPVISLAGPASTECRTAVEFLSQIIMTGVDCLMTEGSKYVPTKKRVTMRRKKERTSTYSGVRVRRQVCLH
jgi:hypothetical protein